MNPFAFTINLGDFSLGIRWYSICILLGVTIGTLLILKEGKRFNINWEFLFNLVFWCIFTGIIGARIYYVIFNFSIYADNLVSIFKIWEGGLAIHGGIIAGLITMLFYCKKYRANTIRIIDLCVPALAIGQAIGRWGNFFNSEAHGSATTLAHLQNLHIPNFIIKGMYISGNYYHPTFLYESIGCILIFLLIIILRRIKYIKVGTPTSFYLMGYGVIRFFVEGMRTDSLMFAGLKVAQIVSILMFIIGVIIFIKSLASSKFENLYNNQDGADIKF